MEEVIEFELSREFLERFKEALDARDSDFVKDALAGVKPADITAILYEFNAEESKYVFSLLPDSVNANILIELDEDVREGFMTNFTAEELARFIQHLDSDDGADVLSEIPMRKREEVIGNLADEEKAGDLLDLLRYDEDVAGGLMAKELIKAYEHWTIKQCIEEIRKQAERVEKIFSVYVVDAQGVLLGRVSLKKILLANDSTRISEIFDKDIVSVGTFDEEREVANVMQKYDLESIPVVNVRGKLVGRITIDDVVDVITETAEEERQLMAGVSSDVEEDDTVWMISKARLPWLIIGMVGGMLAAQIAALYSEGLEVIARLSYFIPLIMATGGNVGIQSSSIVVQSLAVKNVFADSFGNRIVKVIYVAVVNGSILGTMVFGAIILIFRDQMLAITASIALFTVVLLASFMGTITPLLLHRMGINPALASGPFITTANDLVGITVYFTMAYFLYNL